MTWGFNQIMLEMCLKKFPPTFSSWLLKSRALKAKGFFSKAVLATRLGKGTGITGHSGWILSGPQSSCLLPPLSHHCAPLHQFQTVHSDSHTFWDDSQDPLGFPKTVLIPGSFEVIVKGTTLSQTLRRATQKETLEAFSPVSELAKDWQV